MHSNDLVQDFVGNDVDIAIIENDNEHIRFDRVANITKNSNCKK